MMMLMQTRVDCPAAAAARPRPACTGASSTSDTPAVRTSRPPWMQPTPVRNSQV